MLNVTYTSRAYLKPNQQVMVRVRWNKCAYVVSFVTGVYAEKSKWNMDLNRAVKNTTHKIGRMTFHAADINGRIVEFQEVISEVFNAYAANNSLPNPEQLKAEVNQAMGRTDDKPEEEEQVTLTETFAELRDRYIEENKRLMEWTDRNVEKHRQAIDHLLRGVPGVSPFNISLESLCQLRDWFVKNGYVNRTIAHRITLVMTFLHWVDAQDGYHIPKKVFTFKTKLKVLPKTVTFLTYDELKRFAQFDFGDRERLAFARDMWVFMACTSLRISDLKELRYGHISNGHIQMNAQKTGEILRIPLIADAKAILEKYKGKGGPDGRVFKLPHSQKLNNTLKKAATIAGLDRVIVDVKMCGKKRIETPHKLCEILACHDARRTFVCVALARGIAPEIIMKCTGHACYNTMRPYIDTDAGTIDEQFKRWDEPKPESELTKMLQEATPEQMAQILAAAKNITGAA